MLKKTKPKHVSISVTDLSSYAADVTAFIKYKQNGITDQQKNIGNDFHDSLHKSKQSNKGVLYVALGVVCIGIIINYFFL